MSLALHSICQRANALANCCQRPPHWQGKWDSSRRTGRQRYGKRTRVNTQLDVTRYMSQTEFDAEMERVDSKAVRGLRIPSRCHRCSGSSGDGPLPNGCATPVWAVVTSYISERFP